MMKDKKIVKLVTSIVVWILYIIWILQFSSIELKLTNFLAHLLFLVVIVAIYFKDLKEYLKKYKDDKKHIKKVLLYALILIGILFVSNIIISVIANIMGNNFDADSSSKAISKVFSNLPWGTLFACFLTVIFYSVVEELIFRKSIRDVIDNKILFIVCSSLITWYFQATIFSPKLNEFIISLSVLFNSIFASIIFVKKDNILYTIFPRMLYNLLVCCIQLIPLLAK